MRQAGEVPSRRSTQRRRRSGGGIGEIPLTPMIDCVFLLLVFFLVSSSIVDMEFDHLVVLPGVGDDRVLPDELLIEMEGAVIVVNGVSYQQSSAAGRLQLQQLLAGVAAYVLAAEATLPVVIVPSPDTPHQQLAALLVLCHQVGLQHITFGAGL